MADKIKPGTPSFKARSKKRLLKLGDEIGHLGMHKAGLYDTKTGTHYDDLARQRFLAAKRGAEKIKRKKNAK